MDNALPRPFSFASRSRSPGALDSMRAALALVDALLRAIEDAAWSVREASAKLASDVASGASTTRDDLRDGAHRLARLSALSTILSRIVASYRWHQTKAAFLTRAAAARSLEKLHRKNARLLREAAAKHGGGVLKVGQLLSARPDVMPIAYVEELSVLQDAAPSIDFDDVRSVVERELGGTIEDRFARFEREPLAAASIGQVHRATLHDGREVAVKVQRPGIDRLVGHDLALMGLCIESLQSMLPPADHQGIARAISAAIVRELDYAEEAGHARAIADCFRAFEGFDVPEPIEALSTPRVLTTRFAPGTKITTVLDAIEARLKHGDDEAPARRDRILGRLLEAWLRQILQFGRFQADPHPGNVLVTDDDTIVLLDFGCTQVLTPVARRAYLSLVQAAIVRDEDGMTAALDTAGFRTQSGKPDTLHRFALALIGSFARAEGEASWPTEAELLADAKALMNAVTDDPVTVIPDDFVMIARVLGTLGGLFMRYRPKLDVAARVLPVVLDAFGA
jgi:ubiquinone biosynthesis protein